VGDPGRLAQVLNNLVSNAVKFTERGYILIRAGSTRRSQDRMAFHLSVRDTGVGIPPDKQASLFMPFVQADASTARRFGGSGLGLTIVKRLTEAMGGQVRLTSEPGVGTTFTVDLELGLETDGAMAAPRPQPLAGRRVLLVDDQPINLRLLSRQLRGSGVQTIQAASGAEALACVEAALERGEPFDAAILDRRMPGMGGEELGMILRQDPRCPDLALLALTHTGAKEDAPRLEDLGFDAYLTKPLRAGLLLEALALALGRRATGGAFVTRFLLGEGTGQETAPEASRLDARILLVEDQETNQILAARFLEDAGARVQVAANGLDALDLLARERFDLVVMDCQMPGMDGFEATERIRAQEAGTGRHLPIIAMTANAMAGDRERCLRAGMDDYLTKPITRAGLLEGVSRRLNGRPAASPGSGPDPAARARFQALAPVLDVGAALARCGGDGELLARLLHLQLKGEDPLAVLRRALAAGDRPAAFRAAHSMKGNAGLLEAGDLSLASQRLEALLRDPEGDWEAALEALATLHGAFLDQVRAWAQDQEAPPDLPVAGGVPSLLAALDAALERRSFEANRILGSLADRDAPGGLLDALPRLQSLVDRMAFRDARRLLKPFLVSPAILPEA